MAYENTSPIYISKKSYVYIVEVLLVNIRL